MTRTFQQSKILLVDDNDMGRQMVRALLENVGMEVTEAHNGLDAVNRISEETFDLVLMDMQMPILDGCSAARKIRTLECGNSKTLPIIAMTANSIAECRGKSFAAGMNGHISKPIDLDILCTELSRWLPQEKQPQLDLFRSSRSTDFSSLSEKLTRIDVNAGMNRVAGDQQLYLKLLNRFVARFSTLESELKTALHQEEKAKAVRYIHTLRGVAGGLGAVTLQKLAEQLESQIAQSENVSMLDSVIRELDFLFAEIAGVLEQKDQGSVIKTKVTGNKDELTVLCKQLLAPLLTLQVQQVRELLGQVKNRKWPQKYHDRLVQLEGLIEQYQFIPAADLIETFLEESE